MAPRLGALLQAALAGRNETIAIRPLSLRGRRAVPSQKFAPRLAIHCFNRTFATRRAGGHLGDKIAAALGRGDGALGENSIRQYKNVGLGGVAGEVRQKKVQNYI